MIKNVISSIGHFFILLCVMSCSRDNNLENYYYLSQDEALDVGYPYGSIIYKSSQQYSYSDILITSNIIAFKENSKFATVKQQINIDLLKKWIRESIENFIIHNGYNGVRKELRFYDYAFPDTLLLKYNNSDSSITYLTNLVLASSIIQKAKQNNTNYWIIQKSNDSLIGPLTKSEFEFTKKEMQIPDKLKLD